MSKRRTPLGKRQIAALMQLNEDGVGLNRYALAGRLFGWEGDDLLGYDHETIEASGVKYDTGLNAMSQVVTSLRDRGLVKGDTGSERLTPLGRETVERLKARGH